jgi:hypothetical protein
MTTVEMLVDLSRSGWDISITAKDVTIRHRVRDLSQTYVRGFYSSLSSVISSAWAGEPPATSQVTV